MCFKVRKRVEEGKVVRGKEKREKGKGKGSCLKERKRREQERG
jgi:hypothetical protein